MTARRFGAQDLPATTYVVLMAGASGKSSTVNVRFVNRTGSPIDVRLALVDAPAAGALAALTDDDYLEFDLPLGANDVLENSGIAVPEDHSLVVRASAVGVSAVAYGFEEINR